MSTWYYSIEGKQFGPVSTDDMKSKLSSGLPSDTLVWKEGMPGWAAARTVTELTFTPQQPLAAVQPEPVAQVSPNLAAAKIQAASNPYTAPSTANMFGSEGDYPMPQVKPASFGIYVSLMVSGLFLLFVGIVMMVFSMAETVSPETYDSGVPSDFSIVVTCIGGGLTLGGFIIGLIYVHRAWVVLQPTGTTTSPGLAAWLLVVPLLSIVWSFIAYWKWAKEWNEAKPRYMSLHHAPQAAEGIFLGASICQCVSLVFGPASLVYLILHFIGMKSMCDVINFASENSKTRPGY